MSIEGKSNRTFLHVKVLRIVPETPHVLSKCLLTMSKEFEE